MLASTRFNSKTYQEYQEYKETKQIECIYGAPQKIKQSIPLNTLLFVVEMNNEKNQIEGVGLIRTMIETDRHFIYNDNNYNRYIYRGQYHITREEMQHDVDILNILELIVFKGYTHIKRHSGITIIPAKLLECDRVRGIDLTERMKQLFKYTQKLKKESPP